MRILAATAVAVAMFWAGVASAQITAPQTYTTSAYTIEPFTPSTPITIQGQGVRLRAEPFAGQTPVLSSGSTGLQLTVVGIARQPDWDWYQVILKNGQRAFIRSDLTSAPSRGATTAPARPTVVAATPTPPQPHVYTPPAQPQPYVPPAYTPPVPIDLPAVQLAPPAVQPSQPQPANTGRPSLDLPKPGDPPGLTSH